MHQSSSLFDRHQAALAKAGKSVVVYGTAGFRERAELLDLVAFRLGLFMAVMAKSREGQALGIQISASHNHVEDNGLKVVEWSGGMLDRSLEEMLQIFCNAEDLDEQLRALMKRFPSKAQGSVLIGWDTRPSCQHLATLIKQGVQYGQAEYYELGVVTTPMLHFGVWALNTEAVDEPQFVNEVYLQKFIEHFVRVVQIPTVRQRVLIDTANGVGGIWMRRLTPHLSKYFEVTVFKDGSGDPKFLNDQCGSEHVQKHKQKPIGFESDHDVHLSFDGDADRIVYWIPHH